MTRSLSLTLVCTLVLASSLLARAGDEQGRLILSVSEPDTRRKFSVVLLDPATKKVETLLQADEKQSYVAIGLSPNGNILAVMEDDGKKRQITFRALAKPQEVIRALGKGHIWPAFLDDENVVVAAPLTEGGEKKGMVIKKVNLASGEEVEMQAVPGGIWNDVPLTLSPDRKRLIYYRSRDDRGKDRRGLYILDIEKGTEEPLSEGGTFFSWLPDSQHGYMFNKEEKKLKLVKSVPGKPLEVVSDLGELSVIGVQLKANEVLYTKFKMNEKGRPEGLEAFHLDKKANVETSLSTSIPLDEFSLLRAFVRLQNTDWFVFSEAEPGAKKLRRRPRRLVLARVVGGKLERSILLEGKGGIGFPISLP
ncbi:MAG: hypothetical protein JKY65_22455 [Planctomycetes bacterium]|nr:hypothetical protein [Planctomycetota bacterium]